MTATQTIYTSLELWGAIFLTIGAVFLFSMKEEHWGRQTNMLALTFLMFAFGLFADTFAWAFRGAPGDNARIIIVASNFFSFLFSYLTILAFTKYIAIILGKDVEKSKPVYISYMIMFTMILLLIISQFTDLFYYIDDKNYYHRASMFIVANIFATISMFIGLGLLIKYRKRIDRSLYTLLICVILVPLAAVLVQQVVYGYSLSNLATMLVYILIFLQTLMNQTRFVQSQSEQLVEQQKDLNDMQVRIVISQIQPHFLYNSLNTIYYLCDSDPEMAQEAISNFSDYLRGNMASIASSSPIPITDELAHTKTYIALEQLRFDDELNVVYDLETTNFSVPPLTLQPIVENAIKHGIGKRHGGGTVWIHTYRLRDGYQIIIQDNGVGYEPKKYDENERLHIGSSNVEKSVKIQCGGSVTTESIPGEGTTVTIYIPEHKPEATPTSPNPSDS